jgi:DNA-binding transcriptional MerR regulator
MEHEPVVIPEKIYFKIGEVCELVGVQAHVLRYWETEFPMLSPQKNKSGQRSYRRRDVKMALRIKQLLYNEMFTIAGAKKKLVAEQRSGSKPKESNSSASGDRAASTLEAPTLFENVFEREPGSNGGPQNERSSTPSDHGATNADREMLKTMASHLLELREMLRIQH